MKYIADINKISMRVYIDVVLGRFVGEFEGGNKAAEVSLKNQYIGIIGGSKIKAVIMKQSELYNTEIMEKCLTAAKNLVSVGRHDLALPIMKELGYDESKKTPDETMAKIDSLIRMNELKRARVASTDNGKDKQNEPLSDDTFTRERVAMMSYYKMLFDLDRMTAAEYAHFLKRMCDELERDAKLAKKRMRK